MSTEKPGHPASEVRRTFLEFFGKRGHEVCASGPLVPQGDPTLMFANAGMVPFKDVFTGKDKRPYKRAASSQKCIRISGKHNDLENVGVTARHHTFFEMLGNFSFGDYFKEEAIAYAWDLLTNVYGLDKSRLVVSVFGGEGGIAADDEARDIWRKVTGFSDERIFGLGMKDNFWQMGETGPCGPCSEIHYYLGDSPDLATFNEEPNAQGHGWMEIWNLVFMQFERRIEDGKAILEKLPAPCVDTGMGLERITSVLQGKFSNYDSDLMASLVQKAAEISGKAYGASLADDDVSMRVIADHARTTAFLIAEGVFPDRAGREYVLRRVMRRAIRHGHRLGIAQPFLHEVALEVVRQMGEHYPELGERRDMIANVTENEEVRFRQTIDRGLKILDEEIAELRNAGKNEISGQTAFKLYDTFGFPLDLTEVIAAERGLEVDTAGYEKALAEQRARSEGSKVGDTAVESVWRGAIGAVGGAVRFTGYDREEGTGKVVAIVKGDALVTSAQAGEDVAIVTDATPFYGEAGGQVGDRGVFRSRPPGGKEFTVEDTQKPIEGLIVHHGKVTLGEIHVGDELDLEVSHERRTATRRNHSATHLLHWALRQVVGEQAMQKGSLVGPDRLRFDFSHNRALTPEEISRIEDLVNAKILTDAPVETEVLSIDQARAKGAIAIFEEKYGDVVRVLTMTPDSVELCGGTHARALGEIGLFKVVSEGGVAAGVRRLEVVTGLNALQFVRQIEKTLRSVAQSVRSGPNEVVEKVERVLVHERQLEKEIADLKRKLASGGGAGSLDELTRGARDLAGGAPGKVLAVKIETDDPATLRETAEKLRDKLGQAVVLVGAVKGPKASLVLTVSKSLVDRYKAGELIRSIAQVVGGSGGGRPDMAQAGGTAPEKIDEALASLYTAIA